MIRRAFTFLDLLISLSIIGILISLIMCAVQAAWAAEYRISCQNNLRQIGMSLHSFHDVVGTLPTPVNPARMRQLSWMGFILPYMDENPLWFITTQAFLQDSFAAHDPPHIGYHTIIRSYICPADGRLYTTRQDFTGKLAAYTSYVGNAGTNWKDGVFSEPGLCFAAITDGLSNTLMVGERPPPDNFRAGRWYTGSFSATTGIDHGPENVMPVILAGYATDPNCVGPVYSFSYGSPRNPCDRYHFWSLHPEGANFLFTDGSIHFLTYVEAPILLALSTRAGGETINSEW